MIQNKIFHLIPSLLLLIVVKTEDSSYKIVVPNYTCEEESNSTTQPQKNVTELRVARDDNQKFSYNWSINFHVSQRRCRNTQRCNLLLWKNVRELEKYLQKYPINDKGFIEINNTMFIPGVQYILNVIVTNDSAVIEKKTVRLDFAQNQNETKKLLDQVFLWTSDITYVDIDYYVFAEIVLCNPIKSYYIRWEILDSSGNVEKRFPTTKGKGLHVFPYTLKVLQNYTIKVSVMSLVDNSTVCEVSVLKRGLAVNIFPKRLRAASGNVAKINIFTEDLDNLPEIIQIKWLCFTENNDECPEFVSENTTELLAPGIFAIGSYKISSVVMKGAEIKNETVEIVVVKGNRQKLPWIEIDPFPTIISQNSDFEIHAQVYQLSTGCTMQWVSIQESNYAYLDLNEVPGYVNELVTITLSQDLFLDELEEYSNSTTDREFNLVVPPPTVTWTGFEGDVTYLLRLNVTCPGVIDDSAENDDTSEPIVGDDEFVFADVEIQINAAPKVRQLNVEPTNGTAFGTIFMFDTQIATDRETDYPILYKFGYVLGAKSVYFLKINEVAKVTAILPFDNNGIKTVLEACDNRGSCNEIFGPTVFTKLTNIDSNSKNVLQMIMEKFHLQEYQNTLDLAFSLMYSLEKSQNEKLFKTTQNTISSYISFELKQWAPLEVKDEETLTIANDFIKNVKDFANLYPLNEDIINEIISLKRKLSSNNNYTASNKYYTRKLLGFDNNSKERTKRQLNTISNIKDDLEILELTVMASTGQNKVEQAKENVRKQLSVYLGIMCKILYEKPQRIQLEFKSFITSIEKLTKITINNYITIPYEGNTWGTFAKIKFYKQTIEKLQRMNKLCIGKTVFKNHIGKVGFVYLAEVYHSNGKLLDVKENVTIGVSLPVEGEEVTPSSVSCLTWINKWETNECRTIAIRNKNVDCICNKLGYYTVGYDSMRQPVTPRPSISIVQTTASSTTLQTPKQHVTVKTVTIKTDDVTEPVHLNETTSDIQLYKNNTQSFSDILSSVLIVLSTIGIIVLFFMTRSSNRTKHKIERNEVPSNFPKYAELPDEEYLEDPPD